MPLDLTGKAYTRQAARPENNVSGLEEPKKVIGFTSESPKYCLDDLILDNGVKDSLLDAISVYAYQDKIMNQWGLAERYSDKLNLYINLYGESGTGKTMAAHAIAKALNKKIIIVDYAQIESKYVGETSKNIKKMFEDALTQDSVLVFDEADAMLSRRVTDMHSSTDVSVNQTRSVLLNLLNNYRGIVIFTTNFIQNYDPAFIRRIRYQVRFTLPNEELRLKLWKLYIPEQLPIKFKIADLAHNIDGITGSDISNAVFNAAIAAARANREEIDYGDFEKAIIQIKQAKLENNSDERVNVTRRKVSEEYVKEQLGNTSL